MRKILRNIIDIAAPLFAAWILFPAMSRGGPLAILAVFIVAGTGAGASRLSERLLPDAAPFEPPAPSRRKKIQRGLLQIRGCTLTLNLTNGEMTRLWIPCPVGESLADARARMQRQFGVMFLGLDLDVRSASPSLERRDLARRPFARWPHFARRSASAPVAPAQDAGEVLELKQEVK